MDYANESTSEIFEERTVAIKYRKVKVFDGLYIYVNKGIVENIIGYEPTTEVLIYEKNDKQKFLHNTMDIDFILSDDKYGFSDLFTETTLCKLYKEDYETALEMYKEECKSFFRICLVDEEKQMVKELVINLNDLEKAKVDSTVFPQYVTGIGPYGDTVMLATEALDDLIEDIENDEYKKALKELKMLKETIQQIKDSLKQGTSLKSKNKFLNQIEKELNSLVGLENVKEFIVKLKSYANYLDKVKDATKLEMPNLNMVFSGNTGTGKTTSAHIISQVLYCLGYTNNPYLTQATSQDFVSIYSGQTAVKTELLLDQCKGGVLLIDDVSAFIDDSKELAHDALSQILNEMDNKEIIFIFNGSPSEIKQFLNLNKKIKSRINFSLDFRDYTEEELFEIFERKRKQSKIQISDATKKEVIKLIKAHKGEPNFGNARYMDQLFEKMIINHACNTNENNSMRSLKQLHVNDIKNLQTNIGNTETKLNDLIGLEEIKKFVLKLKAYLKYLNKVDNEVKLETPNLNMVFSGNPGTGKTTIARIIASILYELGYAKSNSFKETTAQDFIAGYVGQTAIKSRNVIDSCKGGVILIDEAYVFASEAQNYAQEALVEILKEMETRYTIFIFAGYKDEMKKFINMNPGIKSRIGNYIDFKDYTTEELYQILLNKLNNSKLKLAPGIKDNIIKIIEEHKGTEKFGNGRFIDQLFDVMIRNHAYNCSNVDDINKLKTITEKDLEGISEELKKDKVKKLGF